MFKKTDDQKTETQAKSKQPAALSKDELDAVAAGGGWGAASYQFAFPTTYANHASGLTLKRG